jgi:hypothetical protein
VSGGASGVVKLRAYLKDKLADQRLFNQVWGLLASSRFKDAITPPQRDAVIQEIRSRQQNDGGWSLSSLGPWRWSRATGPFMPPGTLDTLLIAASDGFATGLVVYALREAGVSVDDGAVGRGLRWLRTNQQRVQVGDRTYMVWRAHSLNYDREHGGPKGVPWRQMFMSNSATAFAALALASPECATSATGRC